MRIIAAFALLLLTACGTPADVQADNTPATAAAVADDAPAKIVAGSGCKRSAEDHAAHAATHAANHGEGCDCQGCDKAAHGEAHADATHASAHADATHADCACNNEAQTRWCDSCNRGFINGEPTSDKDAVKAALDAGV